MRISSPAGNQDAALYLVPSRYLRRKAARWLLAQRTVAGYVVVDAGAERAIQQNKSLLPVGIARVRAILNAVLFWCADQ